MLPEEPSLLQILQNYFKNNLNLKKLKIKLFVKFGCFVYSFSVSFDCIDFVLLEPVNI